MKWVDWKDILLVVAVIMALLYVGFGMDYQNTECPDCSCGDTLCPEKICPDVKCAIVPEQLDCIQQISEYKQTIEDMETILE